MYVYSILIPLINTYLGIRMQLPKRIFKRSSGVLYTQWPAVIAHRLEIKAPPHEILLLRKDCFITATCQG